jgi:hypothetical protein
MRSDFQLRTLEEKGTCIISIMDNFTIAVIVGDVVMCLAFVALIVFDKPRPKTPEPVKATGKRSA